VKAGREDDSQVGDRANDRVRVAARDLRARVLAEGGNLGCTQKARLEFWEGGGLINTDAVDNSGGVDTSDHEVNIKILLDRLVKKGVIKGREERNHILAEMTEEVAALVLADNDSQALALSLDGLRSAKRYEEFVAFIDDLAGAGVLSRADDAVPSREELLSAPQKERGLPRPLLAVLLGHTKMFAFEMLLETAFPDSPSGRPLLEAYFPARLRESFREHFDAHVLRREIIATAAVNQVVNQAGICFLSRVMAASKAGLGEVVKAYVDADREAQAGELRKAVLAKGLGAKGEQEALLEIDEALEESVRGHLEGHKKIEIPKALKAMRARFKS
jgi:glutamate dehydrogenase